MSIYDIEVEKRDGSLIKLDVFKNKVLLIVNTATGCGFTPQYEELEALYEKYNKDGFEVLDFPCNQFGHQAPGDNDEIHEFCTLRYNTKFDQFAKIDVNGDNESNLYKYLKNEIKEEKIEGIKNKIAMKSIEKISTTCKKEGDIKWNFTKFLVDRNGKVVKRYDPTSKPFSFEEDIKECLNEK